MTSLPPSSPPQSEQWDSDESYDSDGSSDPRVLWEEADIDCNESRIELADLKAKIIQAKDRLLEENATLDHVLSQIRGTSDYQDKLEADIRKTLSETVQVKDDLNHAQLKADSTKQYAEQVEQDLVRLRVEMQIAQCHMKMAIEELDEVRQEVKEAKDELEDVRQKTKKTKRQLLDLEAGCKDLTCSKQACSEEGEQQDNDPLASVSALTQDIRGFEYALEYPARYGGRRNLPPGREPVASMKDHQWLESFWAKEIQEPRKAREQVGAAGEEQPWVSSFKADANNSEEPFGWQQWVEQMGLIPGESERVGIETVERLKRKTPEHFGSGPISPPKRKPEASMMEHQTSKVLWAKDVLGLPKIWEQVGADNKEQIQMGARFKSVANPAGKPCLHKPKDVHEQQQEEETPRKAVVRLRTRDNEQNRAGIDYDIGRKAERNSDKRPAGRDQEAQDHTHSPMRSAPRPGQVNYRQIERSVTGVLMLLAWLALVNLMVLF